MSGEVEGELASGVRGRQIRKEEKGMKHASTEVDQPLQEVSPERRPVDRSILIGDTLEDD